MSVPRTPEAITADWLSGALGRPVGSVEVARVGTGQIARSFRLTLDGGDTLVAKMQTPDAGTLKAADIYHLYRKEVAWYAELARHCDIRHPACHFHAIADDGLAYLLLLEDGAPARQGDQLAGESESRLNAALAEAARLHGAFAGERLSLAEPLAAFPDMPTELQVQMFAHHWPGFRERYAERLDADILALGDRLLPRYGDFIDYESEHPSLCHRDFRVDNLLFGHPDGRVIVLDWQTLQIGAPASDAAYLIGTSAVGDPDYRAYFDRYAALCREHGYAPPEASLWRDYRVGALSGFAVAVGSAMMVERTERGDEMFAVMAERPAHMALALDSLGVLVAST